MIANLNFHLFIFFKQSMVSLKSTFFSLIEGSLKEKHGGCSFKTLKRKMKEEKQFIYYSINNKPLKVSNNL